MALGQHLGATLDVHCHGQRFGWKRVDRRSASPYGMVLMSGFHFLEAKNTVTFESFKATAQRCGPASNPDLI